jgi:hypothetical protein
MGISGFRAQAAAPPPPLPSPPALSPEAVEEMCKEAYAAGIEDADVYGTAQREAMLRQNAAVGVAACMLSAWLAFVYGRTNGTRLAEEAAALRFNAQQQMLDKVNSDLVAVAEENKTLTLVRKEQQMIIAQQRNELQKAARQRRAMQQSLQSLKLRNASVRKQLRGLTTSLHAIQRQMYVGMAGAGVLLLAVVWGTRPLRQGRLHPPAVAQSQEWREGLTPAPPALEHTVEVEREENAFSATEGEAGKEESKLRSGDGGDDGEKRLL